jgi:hypothetical protein
VKIQALGIIPPRGRAGRLVLMRPKEAFAYSRSMGSHVKIQALGIIPPRGRAGRLVLMRPKEAFAYSRSTGN